MQAAIDDQQHVVARNPAVEHAATIIIGFSGQVTSLLDDDFRLRQRVSGVIDDTCQIFADRRLIEPRLSGELGSAEIAGEVQRSNRRGIGQPQGDLVTFLLRLDDGFGLEAQRTGVQVIL